MGENQVGDEAFVSLVTNDNYANGALVLGYSLRRVNTTRKLALLVTNQVTAPVRQVLALVCIMQCLYGVIRTGRFDRQTF